MPRRPRPHTAKTLLSRVSAFLPQALIFPDGQVGGPQPCPASREQALGTGERLGTQAGAARAPRRPR